MIYKMDYKTEFQRQVDNLIEKGYAKLAATSEVEFSKLISSLENRLKSINLVETNFEKGTLPFVIVVKNQLIRSERMMKLVEKDGQKGVTILRPLSAENFETIEEMGIHKASAYLIVNIDRGSKTLNVRPSEALELIKREGRLPLTIDEGIAIVTHYPEFLRKNNCFSLLASRTGKDKRVPAIWINAKKEPNLGWCWEGNPHTWLGSASCELRI
jgi:hypothetical protein